MERVIISWSLPNIITVALMAIIAWLVIGLVWQYAKKLGTPNEETDKGGE